jgi:hypothetical protein
MKKDEPKMSTISTFIIGTAGLQNTNVHDTSIEPMWRLQLNGSVISGHWTEPQLKELLLVLKAWKESLEK